MVPNHSNILGISNKPIFFQSDEILMIPRISKTIVELLSTRYYTCAVEATLSIKEMSTLISFISCLMKGGISLPWFAVEYLHTLSCLLTFLMKYLMPLTGISCRLVPLSLKWLFSFRF